MVFLYITCLHHLIYTPGIDLFCIVSMFEPATKGSTGAFKGFSLGKRATPAPYPASVSGATISSVSNFRIDFHYIT